MIHPHTELRYIDDDIGYGVFATRCMARGTITWTLDAFDHIFTPTQVAAMAPASQEIIANYSYINAAGNCVLCWDLGRYINHSCDPTSLGIGEDVEIAVRDIGVGEQLTSEYGSLNVTTELHCRCGARKCRGVIRGDDLLRHWQEWDALVHKTLALVAHVPQPLWPFMQSPGTLTAILNHRTPLPSHLQSYSPQSTAAAPAPQNGSTGKRGLWAFPATS